MILSLTCVLAIAGVVQVSGHSALQEPPARNTMWRLGFNELPFHPEDTYLMCVQTTGKCPPCGDKENDPFPHPHEAGGEWATGTITRSYSSGQVIDIFVNVTRSHGGYIEFKLCPNNNVRAPVKQSCLDQYPLAIAGTGRTKHPLRAPFDSPEPVNLQLQLPEGLECSQCVLQMTQTADQFKPADIMFRNCADVEITQSAAGSRAPPKHQPNRFRSRPSFFKG